MLLHLKRCNKCLWCYHDYNIKRKCQGSHFAFSRNTSAYVMYMSDWNAHFCPDSVHHTRQDVWFQAVFWWTLTIISKFWCICDFFLCCVVWVQLILTCAEHFQRPPMTSPAIRKTRILEGILLNIIIITVLTQSSFKDVHCSAFDFLGGCFSMHKNITTKCQGLPFIRAITVSYWIWGLEISQRYYHYEYLDFSGLDSWTATTEGENCTSL